MPILTPTALAGRVVWLGRVPDRAAGLASEPVARVEAGFDGIAGEAHGGLTRPSCSRVKLQYPRGTEIRNTRQIAIVSAEELAEIAVAMGLDALEPAWLGASMVVEGLPAFTRIPPSSRLIFDGGTGLVVDMENAPCRLPAAEIERHHPGKGRNFAKHAAGRRGVTAWVERPGAIGLGERLMLHIPPQRLYEPGLPARSRPASALAPRRRRSAAAPATPPVAPSG